MNRFLLLLLSLVPIHAISAERPNVLFIAVDDLRPELGCYGKQHIHSPNIDRLAKSGVLFERAYCMVPTCGASRASLMTGIRPARKRFVNYLAWAEKDAPGLTTFNTQFKNNGYITISLGKVFHHPEDNSEGWSEPAWRPKGIPWYRRPENHERHEKLQKQVSSKRGPAWESADVPDTLWCKHSCYETSMQIPLIVRAPGIEGGVRRTGLIESIDLYPSLCELAGLSLPEHLHGRSFATLMKNPEAEWKSAAVGRFQNGDTIRTDTFRFTEYTNAKGQPTSRMLYEHANEPSENVNVAETREDSSRQLAEELHRLKGIDGDL